METFERVFLGLGSNIGDRLENLEHASRLIDAKCGGIVKRASIYETDPVELLDQPAFLNTVVEIKPTLPPAGLMMKCLAIETELGRIRAIPKGPRIIDIDLLLYGQRVIDANNPVRLVVPHPAMGQRRFVLEPLAEIAGEVKHPQYGETITDLLDKLTDRARVTKLP